MSDVLPDPDVLWLYLSSVGSDPLLWPVYPIGHLWDTIGKQAEVRRPVGSLKHLLHSLISSHHWSREAMQMIALKDGSILRSAKMAGVPRPH